MSDALRRIKWGRDTKVKSAADLKAEDKRRNLVLVFAGRNNAFTQEALKMAVEEFKYEAFHFEQMKDSPDRWEIVDGIAHYPSPSYEQIKRCEEEGLNLQEEEIEDVALVAKMANPWNPNNKMLILAGVRAFGTWGAAQCFNEAHRKIYPHEGKSGGKKKHGDFAAVIGVKYKNCDIVHTGFIT
jgi:hypothetical protein